MKIKQHIFCLCLCTLPCILIPPGNTFAQGIEGDQTLDSSHQEQVEQIRQEIQLLEEKKRLEEARRDYIEVQNQAESANFPVPDENFEVLEGNITIASASDTETLSFETHTLGYQALELVSQAIADEIVGFIQNQENENINLVIFDQKTFNELKAYRAYQITIGSIRASYDSRFGINDYIDDGYPAPETYATVKTIEAAQAIAQAFAGLLSLFRTDRQITNFSFDSIPESALISQLNSALQGQSTEITVYYPGNYSFDFSSELGFALNEIFVEIDDLQDLLSRGKEKLGNSAENGLTNSEANDLRALNQLTEDFIQTFSDNNETTEQNALIHLASIRPLACLLQGNGLRCDSFSQGAYVLKVDITSGRVVKFQITCLLALVFLTVQE